VSLFLSNQPVVSYITYKLLISSKEIDAYLSCIVFYRKGCSSDEGNGIVWMLAMIEMHLFQESRV
jgi:hypothetical protein